MPGLSERIRVRSIVGRYLEHSRIFPFANGAGAGAPALYIGSADLMPRNLDRRIEALAPVSPPDLQQRLQEILDVNLSDDTLAWCLGSRRRVEPRRAAAARSTRIAGCRNWPWRGRPAGRSSPRSTRGRWDPGG